jgi:hypothetical protein
MGGSYHASGVFRTWCGSGRIRLLRYVIQVLLTLLCLLLLLLGLILVYAALPQRWLQLVLGWPGSLPAVSSIHPTLRRLLLSGVDQVGRPSFTLASFWLLLLWS